jgi:hypothetical protein
MHADKKNTAGSSFKRLRQSALIGVHLRSSAAIFAKQISAADKRQCTRIRRTRAGNSFARHPTKRAIGVHLRLSAAIIAEKIQPQINADARG